jgi:hypothetical protein
MAGVGDAGAEERRLEEARVVVPHDLGHGDSGQVGRPLMLAARAEGLAEAEEDERAGEEGGEDAEEQEGGLAGLGVSDSHGARGLAGLGVSDSRRARSLLR